MLLSDFNFNLLKNAKKKIKDQSKPRSLTKFKKGSIRDCFQNKLSLI